MKKCSVSYGIISITLLLIFGTSCSDKQTYYEESGTIFHTLYKIKYEAKQPLNEKIDSTLKKFNQSLNPFNPHSIIAKVNRNEPVVVDAWFSEVFNKSQEISKQTEGVFDITAGPLINLWGFGFSKMDSVTPAMIDSIRQIVGYQKVSLKDAQVHKQDNRTLLNCSAIAKGYACDVIAELLESEGVNNYMVEIGGEVTMQGVNPNGDCWRIGISKPEDDSTGITNEIQEIVMLCKKGGIATSGNYRNFYIKDGKKYAHTIDPRTGYPSEQNILSATVIADDCITADAYATAFMAMGVEMSQRVAKNLPDVDYYIIYTDSLGKHKNTYSKGMLQYLVAD
jgi:thiamine biosynthesis lipoprotein